MGDADGGSGPSSEIDAELARRLAALSPNPRPARVPADTALWERITALKTPPPRDVSSAELSERLEAMGVRVGAAQSTPSSYLATSERPGGAGSMAANQLALLHTDYGQPRCEADEVDELMVMALERHRLKVAAAAGGGGGLGNVSEFVEAAAAEEADEDDQVRQVVQHAMDVVALERAYGPMVEEEDEEEDEEEKELKEKQRQARMRRRNQRGRRGRTSRYRTESDDSYSDDEADEPEENSGSDEEDGGRPRRRTWRPKFWRSRG